MRQAYGLDFAVVTALVYRWKENIVETVFFHFMKNISQEKLN